MDKVADKVMSIDDLAELGTAISVYMQGLADYTAEWSPPHTIQVVDSDDRTYCGEVVSIQTRPAGSLNGAAVTIRFEVLAETVMDFDTRFCTFKLNAQWSVGTKEFVITQAMMLQYLGSHPPSE